MSMGTVKRKIGPLHTVKLDTASKLAEQWVSSMGGYVEDEPEEVEPEGQRHRLGLGARQSQPRSSNAPFERKLLAKMNVGKRKAITYGEDGSNEEEDEGDLGSRCSIFINKRGIPHTTAKRYKQ